MAERYQPYGIRSDQYYYPPPGQHYAGTNQYGAHRGHSAGPPPPPAPQGYAPPAPGVQANHIHPNIAPTPPPGNPYRIKHPPSSFVQSQEHLDTNNGKTGLKMFRQIQSTAWSRKENINGVLIEDLRIVDMMNKGFSDEGLRFISHGYEQNIVLVKERKDAIFLSYLMKHIRAKSYDVDVLAANAHRAANQSVPDKTAQAEAFMQPIVDAVLKSLAPFVSQDDAESAAQVELNKLREENDNMKATMTPRKPTLPAEDTPHEPKTSASQQKLSQAFMKQTFAPPPLNNKFLESSCPNDEKAKSIRKWMQSIKHEISEEESTILDKFIRMTTDQWKKSSTAKRASLPDLAAKYGLPVKYAGKWKEENLLMCIAVAAFRTL